MDEVRSESKICFVGALAEVGRMLTWLGENCETFSLMLAAPQPLTSADQALSIQVGFRDRFEAAAFRSRFLPGSGWRPAP